jgi:hypothetical protein
MRRRERVGWWSTFAAFSIAGIVWALSVPPMSGPDEWAHVVKAAAVTRGELQTRVEWTDVQLLGLRVPVTSVEVPEGYDNGSLFRRSLCWNTTSEGVALYCLQDLPGEAGPTVKGTTYVGTYQPSYYAAVGLPTLVLPPDSGVLVARIASALIVAALLASALTSSATFGGVLSTTATLLAITPAFVYISGVVNPSAVEVAASLALWTSLLALTTDPRAPRRVVARTAVAGVCLVTVRPLAPAIAVAIVGAVVVVAADRDRLRTLWARRSVRISSAVVLAAWAGSAIYVLATNAYSSIVLAAIPDQRSASTLAGEALGNTGAMLREQVGLLDPLGITALRTPEPIVDAWLVAIGGLVVAAMAVGTARQRIGLGLVVLGSLAVPVAARVANPDAIWLGRYSLPLIVGIPLVAGWVLDRSGRIPARVGAGALIVTTALVASVHLIDYGRLVRRNLHDYPRVLSARLGSRLWDGPFTAGSVRIAAVLASLALVAAGTIWALTSTRGPVEDPGRRDQHT